MLSWRVLSSIRTPALEDFRVSLQPAQSETVSSSAQHGTVECCVAPLRHCGSSYGADDVAHGAVTCKPDV